MSFLEVEKRSRPANGSRSRIGELETEHDNSWTASKLMKRQNSALEENQIHDKVLAGKSKKGKEWRDESRSSDADVRRHTSNF